MNLDKIKEWFHGWCPKGSISPLLMLQSLRQAPPVPSRIVLVYALFLIALGLYAVQWGIYGLQFIGDGYVVRGILRLLSILFLLFLCYLCFRWLRPSLIWRSGLNVRTIVVVIFGFYALSILVDQFLSIDPRLNPANFFGTYALDYILRAFASGMFIVSGFYMLRVSSNILKGEELDKKNLRITALSLGSYGAAGLISELRITLDFWYYDAIQSAAFDPYSLRVWISWLGYGILYGAVLLLFLDVFRRSELRKQSVYLTSLLVGVAWLLQNISVYTENLLWLNYFRWRGLYSLPEELFITILLTLTSVLVIAVSYSLVRGGELKGRTLRRSLTAIFLYGFYWLTRALIGLAYYVLYHPATLPTLPSDLPYSITLLILGLQLYGENKEELRGSVIWRLRSSLSRTKAPMTRRMRLLIIVMFFARVRSLLTQKKVKVVVSAAIIIFLVMLTQGGAIITYFSPTPSEWKHIAHYEDPVGDHMSPSVDINGTALGGVNYEGADIINVSMYSPVNSNELTLTVCLKNKGRADSTMDENNTRVMIWFGGDKWGGYAYLYYNGWRGFGVCSNLTDGYEYDIIRPPTERLQWASDNVMKVTFKGLPQGVVLSYLRVETGMEYVEETETEYGALILRDLDNLLIENYDYDLSSGETVTLQDLSKQLSPLFNSTMRGMDIQMVDVYRRGKYVSITVALSDLGINDSSIPSTFKIDRRIVTVQLKEKKPTSGPMTYEWNDLGNCCNVTFNLDDYGGLENVQVIKIDTFAKFYPMLDGEIVDGGYSLRWKFDFYYFSMPR